MSLSLCMRTGMWEHTRKETSAITLPISDILG